MSRLSDKLTELGFVRESDTIGGTLYEKSNPDGSRVSVFIDNAGLYIQVGNYPSNEDEEATMVTWSRVCTALFAVLSLWAE